MSKKSSDAKASKSKASSSAKSTATEKKSAKSNDSSDSAASKTDGAVDKSQNSSTETSATEKSTPETSSDSDGRKSQKETISTGDVHYGYFSSVRTPAYRKGWDDIFSKNKSADSPEKKTGSKARKNSKSSQIKAPLNLELDINELPEALRTALADEIRRQTKRRRINYDKLDAAGAVYWQISCEIKR